MADLHEYEYVTSNGVITTAMLSEQDAARLGAVPVAGTVLPPPKSRTVADKSRTATDKG